AVTVLVLVTLLVAAPLLGLAGPLGAATVAPAVVAAGFAVARLGRLDRRGADLGRRLVPTAGAVARATVTVVTDGLQQVRLAHLRRHGDTHAPGQALQLGQPHRTQRAGAGGGGHVSGVCHEGSFPLVGAARHTGTARGETARTISGSRSDLR